MSVLFSTERPEIAIDLVQVMNGYEIRVNWTVTFGGNLDIIGCNVGYTEVLAEKRMVENTTDSDIILKNLMPYTNYTIDVTCSNSVGSSNIVQEGPVATMQSGKKV